MRAHLILALGIGISCIFFDSNTAKKSCKLLK